MNHGPASKLAKFLTLPGSPPTFSLSPEDARGFLAAPVTFAESGLSGPIRPASTSIARVITQLGSPSSDHPARITQLGSPSSDHPTRILGCATQGLVCIWHLQGHHGACYSAATASVSSAAVSISGVAAVSSSAAPVVDSPPSLVSLAVASAAFAGHTPASW
jgi:hypothetical protein